MNASDVNVLLIGEDERIWWNLARHLERLPCRLWFAASIGDARELLKGRDFCLALSTQPVTEGNPMAPLLKRAVRNVFYSFPIEDSCLWFLALGDVMGRPGTSALRPSEFFDILSEIVAAEHAKIERKTIEIHASAA
jgi:hypothetical protein